LIGGLIVQHLSWRWMFWVNVPFCVVGLILAWRLMPIFPGNGKSRLDGIGLALVSPGVAAVVYGLAQVGPNGGFGHVSVLVPLLAGSALIIAFTIRALAIGSGALVDVRLFRVGSFSAAAGLLFLSGFALYGAMLLIPLYFQQVRGQQAFAAGLLVAAQGVGVLASRSLAGRLTDQIGARWVAFTGLVVVALATLPFALATAHTPEWWLVATVVLRGIGLGAVTIPVMASAYIGLDQAAIADASIITRTAQQIGGSFGTAVLAVVLERAIAQHASAGIRGVAAGFDVAFWWSIAFTAVAIVLTLWLPARSPS